MVLFGGEHGLHHRLAPPAFVGVVVVRLGAGPDPLVSDGAFQRDARIDSEARPDADFVALA